MDELKALKLQLALLNKEIKELTKATKTPSIKRGKRGPRKSTIEREKEAYHAYMRGLIAKMKNPSIVMTPTEIVDCYSYLRFGNN